MVPQPRIAFRLILSLALQLQQNLDLFGEAGENHVEQLLQAIQRTAPGHPTLSSRLVLLAHEERCG